MITDLDELDALLDGRRTLFRLETLDVYEVASDGSDYRRYLDGEREPDWERKQPWLDEIRAERESGGYRHRVHVLRTPLGRVGRIEAASRLLRTFHPAVVIGLLQTPGYIRGLLGESLPDDEVERMVAARGERQRLLDTDREFVLIMTEGALRWHVGSPAVMIAQLQHLAEATRRSNVHVGVIPWTKPVRTGALHGFNLYDRRAAIVGTETATAIITDARDIADYEACFAIYEALAVYGADARQVFDRLSDEYRTLDQ
ncbi:MAG: DUF5753 domain-containing protein [Pseudonocardiaceae bacterium]